MLPIVVFLKLVDIPLADRVFLLDLAHQAARPLTPVDRIAALTGMQSYLADHVRRRRGGKGDDLISVIVNGDISGRVPTETEALSICTTVMLGGLDTVASMLGFVALHLAEHPSHRQLLATNPDRIAGAVEEFIRRHGVANTARMLTRDHNQGEAHFREGDQILLPNALVGLDDEITPNAMRIDLDRAERERGSPLPKSRHAAFGNGPHACPGATLARRELRIFLEEWLARIPDFTLRNGTRPQFATGTINAVQRLDLVWPD